MISVKIAKISEPVQEDEDVLVDIETFREVEGVYILKEDISTFKKNPSDVLYRLISVGQYNDHFIHYHITRNDTAEIRISRCLIFDTDKDRFYNTGEQVYFNVGE